MSLLRALLLSCVCLFQGGSDIVVDNIPQAHLGSTYNLRTPVMGDVLGYVYMFSNEGGRDTDKERSHYSTV